MNSSIRKLPVLPSTANLSPALLDIANVIIFPIIGFYLFLNKSISIYVVLKITQKNRNYGNMFKYILANELADFLLAISATFIAVFRCGNLCEIGYTYFSKLFEIVFYAYMNNVFMIFNTFLEISFTIERLHAFDVNHKEKFSFRTKLMIMIIIALVSSLPNYILARSIKPLGIYEKTNQTLYIMANQDIVDNNQYINISLHILLVLRGPGLYLMVLALNLILLQKFRLRFAEKSKLSVNKSLKKIEITNVSDLHTNCTQKAGNLNLNEREVEANKSNKETAVTRVLLSLGINFLAGNVFSSTTSLFYLILGSRSIIFLVYSLVSITLLLVTHGNNIVIYYYTSPIFRKTFDKSFKFLK